MKKLIQLFFSLLFFCFSFESFTQSTDEQMIDSTANGKTLADFHLVNATGDSINFYSLKGEIIVIDIWATWCGPCKAQAPSFDSLRTKYSNEKIKFISVSIDKPKDKKKWEKYIHKHVPDKSKKDHYLAGNNPTHLINFFTRFYYEYEGEMGIVEGIPQYIIIGKGHEIIERSAPQPQTGDLEKMILEIKKEYGI